MVLHSRLCESVNALERTQLHKINTLYELMSQAASKTKEWLDTPDEDVDNGDDLMSGGMAPVGMM